MKNLKILLFLSCLIIAAPSFSEDDENCDPTKLREGAEDQLAAQVKKITDTMYKEVFSFKVNMDGEGKVSVFYEKGVPVAMKLTYLKKKKETVKELTVEEFKKGAVLSFENPDKPGDAISFSKDASFLSGDKFRFKLNVRDSYTKKGDKFESGYKTYPIVLDPNNGSPKIQQNGQSFTKMTLDPGVKMLSWDGTFKKVEFK